MRERDRAGKIVFFGGENEYSVFLGDRRENSKEKKIIRAGKRELEERPPNYFSGEKNRREPEENWISKCFRFCAKEAEEKEISGTGLVKRREIRGARGKKIREKNEWKPKKKGIFLENNIRSRLLRFNYISNYLHHPINYNK